MYGQLPRRRVSLIRDKRMFYGTTLHKNPRLGSSVSSLTHLLLRISALYATNSPR